MARKSSKKNFSTKKTSLKSGKGSVSNMASVPTNPKAQKTR